MRAVPAPRRRGVEAARWGRLSLRRGQARIVAIFGWDPEPSGGRLYRASAREAPGRGRAAIKASSKNATAAQIQAVYHDRQTVLDGDVETGDEVNRIGNLTRSYDRKSRQVAARVKLYQTLGGGYEPVYGAVSANGNSGPGGCSWRHGSGARRDHLIASASDGYP
jgi:hypothetical protein